MVYRPMNRPSKQEQEALDLIIGSQCSTDFLLKSSDIIFSLRRKTILMGKFYDDWVKSCKIPPAGQVPFSLGALLGYVYVGILYAKEVWFDLIPDVIPAQAKEWNLDGIKYIASKNPQATIRYIFRRIRNALGHGNIATEVPQVHVNFGDLFRLCTITFNDVNPKDSTDSFEITLSFEQLFKLVNHFCLVVEKRVYFNPR